MASVLQVGTREQRKFQDPDDKVADLPEIYRFIWTRQAPRRHKATHARHARHILYTHVVS